MKRRTFLMAATAAAASAAMGRSALETVNIACLGTGGRCRHLMKSLATIKNVRLAAVSDVWD
ncbi:MAG: gfo/Idh/MocA family oxidoreductase, partial [Gemmataceae bacterium]|nr:gfo/Idh/MocA family oxidoreductase [Gemmataceae bacterium]